MIQHKQKDSFVILYCPRFLFINEDEMNEQREREILLLSCCYYYARPYQGIRSMFKVPEMERKANCL